MRYFSMFTGIGGFELGIQQAYDNCNKQSPQIKQDGEGRDRAVDERRDDVLFTSGKPPLCIGFSEIDKYASQLLQIKWPTVKNYGDATLINPSDLPDFDLLCGGFPCQSFSIAGKRKGFDDTRGTLFFDIARIVEKKRPRYLLLENVKGLLSHDQGRTYKTILSTLTELDYDVQAMVLNSKNFGVPQNRERVFIVGHSRNFPRPKVFPIREDAQVSLKRQGQISPTITQRYYKRGQSDPYIAVESAVKPAQWRRTEKGKQFRRESQKRGKDLTPFNNGYRELVPKDSNIIGAITSQAIAKDSLLFNRMRIRRLTPLECERLQGFPYNWTKDFSDTQRYKMCGNAVTVNVIKVIAERLL